MRRNSALSVCRGQQELRNHSGQRLRKREANHILLFGRKGVDDAVDRLGGVVRMQGAEDEHAHFGRGDREADRLHLAHLADQDHVRVLSDGALERGTEALGVQSDFAMREERVAVLVNELDRILNEYKAGRADAGREGVEYDTADLAESDPASAVYRLPPSRTNGAHPLGYGIGSRRVIERKD